MAGEKPTSVLTACCVHDSSCTINPNTAFLLESPLVPGSLVENVPESLVDILSEHLFNRAFHGIVSMRDLYSKKWDVIINGVFDVNVLMNGKSEFVEAAANRRFEICKSFDADIDITNLLV